MRELAEKTVKNMRKVRTVHNELEVAGPTSMVARSNDSWLTTKIKSKMALSSAVDANRFKIVTENGVVYMMGLVTRDEASAAVDLTRQVYGVQKIVKVFEYLN
jgi:osmotically-inducible protein OsmY